MTVRIWQIVAGAFVALQCFACSAPQAGQPELVQAFGLNIPVTSAQALVATPLARAGLHVREQRPSGGGVTITTVTATGAQVVLVLEPAGNGTSGTMFAVGCEPDALLCARAAVDGILAAATTAGAYGEALGYLANE